MRLLRASLVISLAAGTVGLAGCADQGGTQIVVLNHAIPAEGCVLTPSETSAFMSSGLVDAYGSMTERAFDGYIATPLIKNFSDSADGTLETERTVILHGARVELVIGARADGTPLLSDAAIGELNEINALKFTVLFSGAVTPDGGVTVIGFDAIPREVLTAVGTVLNPEGDPMVDERGLIQIVYTVFGETTAGTSVESDPFSFPVQVCVNCLLYSIGPCTEIEDGDYAVGGECNIYQDDTTPCCTVASGSVCPAIPMDPPT